MYRGRPPSIGHLRGFGCDCTFWTGKDMSKGSGTEGKFVGYTPKSPTGTYRVEVKGKRKGTMADSRHVVFHENQVLPKFSDKTKNSHFKTVVNDLLNVKDPGKTPKRVCFADEQGAKTRGVNNKTTMQEVKVKPKTRKKFNVQSLVDEDRVIVPGPNFHAKSGNRSKYIADRLQMLIGLTPSMTTAVKYMDSKSKSDSTVSRIANMT